MVILVLGTILAADRREELRTAATAAGLPDVVTGAVDALGSYVTDTLPGPRSFEIPTLSRNQPRPPQSFEQAKLILREVDRLHPVDRYCGCPYSPTTLEVDVRACGLVVTTHRERAGRIEYEHVVPASHLGNQRPCWRNPPAGTSGREYCRKVDADFSALEADPYNLIPVAGALNAVRAHYRYSEIPGELRHFGACDFEFDSVRKVVEPPAWIKGDIARTYFYMRSRYGHQISDSQAKLFQSWHLMDPVDELELSRHREIANRVGWSNPWVLQTSDAERTTP